MPGGSIAPFVGGGRDGRSGLDFQGGFAPAPATEKGFDPDGITTSHLIERYPPARAGANIWQGGQ